MAQGRHWANGIFALTLIAEEGPKISLYQKLPRHNAPTFENLYKVIADKEGKDQKCILKADRNVLQRLITYNRV